MNDSLQLAAAAPQVYERLKQLKRTGWVMRGVKDPETVYEHTIALMNLGQELAESIEEIDQEELLKMLEVHDWPEAVVGDQVILERTPGEKEDLKEVKFQNEKQALGEICQNLPNGKEIMELWLRFETSDDPIASFARQLDKYQAVEKSLEYEKDQDIQLFEEFLKYSINFIYHPALLKKIDELKLRWVK